MNRDQFFAFSDLVIEKVFVKDMKETFCVRSLSAAEKAAWEQASLVTEMKGAGITLSRDEMRTARERLVEMAVCNEDGSAFFQKGDAERIGAKNARIVSDLYEVAAKLSGITKEDIEEIAKNSKALRGEGSTSA